MQAENFQRPYVISWNLTYRCNLACEHCYLDAGGFPEVTDESFADRSELDTDQCYKVIEEIAAFAPEALTILTGGEPLLRRDILKIIRFATQKELWVVVGTNGISITENLARILLEEGLRGMALSLDALDPATHDGFRRVKGAWDNTVQGASILHDVGLPFIVQTTVGRHNLHELEAIADFAHDRMAAKVWNLYFLVQTGRGQFVSDISSEEYDGVLATLSRIQRRCRSKMIVSAKCAPHYVKQLYAEDPGSPFLKTFAGGAGGCPAGTHYLGIRPNGDVTPCPYLPVFGGNLRQSGLSEIWSDSDVFVAMRRRSELGDRCGACEFNALCGGCRARAYGTSGDYMAEDPLCTHRPGTYPDAARIANPAVEYGRPEETTVAWEPEARERMKRVPAFVRGMVVKAVESQCRRNGLNRVTVDELDRIRSRMPTPKIFGSTRGPRRDD
jgi:radical SAM protein with 4Fe4S-binding SPASM domain